MINNERVFETTQKICHDVKSKTSQKANPLLISSFQIFKKSNRKVLPATLCLLSLVAVATITGGFGSFPNLVRADYVKGIGVGIYWDQSCKNTTLAFQFGQVDPGSNKTLTIYIKNECSSTVFLKLETSNWSPATAPDYISLQWNYTNQVLNVNEVVSIELTLTLNASIYGISDFSFHTTITASQS